jgi:hypothetical protein
VPRRRTAKTLAQRIDLDYFKRLHPFRRWKFILSLALPLIAVVWVVATTITGHQRPYSAGPMSPAHAFVGKRCEVCHTSTAGFFLKHVDDDSCKSCHDGPVHQSRQMFTPACSSCHVEHQGSVQLAGVADRMCTQCHADLRTRDGHARYETAIGNFNTAHPEFAPVRSGKDPGTVKLDHEVHLKAGLKGPRGPVQMVCADCHRSPADARAWPYSAPQIQPVAAAAPDPLAPQPTRAYMSPVNYEKHCAACHLLNFDRRFAEPVPHKEPRVVHEFVVKKLSDYIAAHPEAIRQVEVPVQRIPEVKIETRPARDAADWVSMRVAEAEQLLWKKTCKECHAVKFGATPLPEIPKAQIAVRWLPHSVFSHDPHRMLDCTACHARAPKSKETADVLLPGIATCRQCHASQQTAPTDSAQARCFECHQYHDWTKQVPVNGRYTIPRLLKGM